jgi:hypothetical protein
MTKKSKAAKKGWRTRRKNQAAEFRRRSKASKKGWRRRKAKEKIVQAAKEQPKAKKGALQEWIVTWNYSSAIRSRRVDFMVIAKIREDAALFVVKAGASGQDSQGVDLTWMHRYLGMKFLL